MPRSLACLIVLFTLLAAVLPASGDLYNGSGYTITLGPEWVQIPPDEVQQRLSEGPGTGRLRVDAAFQLKKDKEWFTYPYVMLFTYPYEGSRPPTAADMKKLTNMLNTQTGNPVDLDTKAAKFRTTRIESVDGINIKEWVGGHFGRRDLVRVEGYAHEADYPNHEQKFVAIDDTFQFNSGEEYSGEAITGRKIGRFVRLGVLALIGIGAVLGWLFKRKAA
jgi:hypothetical protein